jgi:hypothetical protein
VKRANWAWWKIDGFVAPSADINGDETADFYIILGGGPPVLESAILL